MQKIRRVEFRDGGSSVLAARMAVGLTGLTLVLLAALHLASPEFDPSWRMVSEYALGRFPWLLSLMFLSWGLGTWALAVAVRPMLHGRSATAGLVFLVLAGLGEAMAAVFDINNDVGHGIAGLLGILGLPIAAILISAALPRDATWSSVRRPLMALALVSWLAVAALVATLILMTIQVFGAYGGQLPSTTPANLPPGVFHLVGWADRLIVLANCAWVFAVARRVARFSPIRVSNGTTAAAADIDFERSAPAS